MQEGPSKPARRYSVADLQRILDIAPHFIDIRTKNIFVLTAGSALPALQEILQTEAFWQSPDPIAAFRQAILIHNDSIPQFIAQRDQLKEALLHGSITSPRNGTSAVYKQIETELEQLAPKLSPIGDYEWAVVCKLAMQSADLLPKTQEARAALEKFTSELKLIHEITSSEMYQRGAAFLRTDFAYLQEIFLETMRKICDLGLINSAIAIHQYMALAQWVLSEREQNEIDEVKIAMTLAPGLFQGLGIFGQIIPRTGEAMHDMRADTREYSLLKRVMMELILAPHFQKSFDISLYVSATQATTQSSPRAQDHASLESSGGSTRHTSILDRFRNFTVSSSSSSSSADKKSKLVARAASEPGSSGGSLLTGYALRRDAPPTSPTLRVSASSRTTTTITQPEESDSSTKSKSGKDLELR